MLRVTAIPGEPTRFYVESNRWKCTNCGYLFLKSEHPFMDAGMPCPRCGDGKIEWRYHLVDIASYDLAGCCSCEWHYFEIAPRLKMMTREQRLEHPPRCWHLEAARNFCLEIALSLHILDEHGKHKINPENEV